MRKVCMALLLALVGASTASAATLADTCASAANAWLASLSEEQRDEAVRPFDHEGRKKWTNLPGGRYRDEGLPFEDMSENQRKLAHRLMQCGLSSQGYQKAVGTMWVDDYLFSKMTNPEMQAVINRGYGFYWVGVFGEPGGDAPWGWQVDGHHLGLNFTVADGMVEVTPAFVGIQPNEIPDGPYTGWRVLGEEEDKALALVNSLDDMQRSRAILSATVPDEIFTGPERGDALTDFEGLTGSDMTDGQRALLQGLIEEYVRNVDPEAADALLGRIAADGADVLHFAWMGPTEAGSPFYYRVHGPSVLIEFDHTLVIGRAQSGERQHDPNHIHTILRQPGQDYGADLLRRHYEEHHADD